MCQALFSILNALNPPPNSIWYQNFLPVIYEETKAHRFKRLLAVTKAGELRFQLRLIAEVLPP